MKKTEQAWIGNYHHAKSRCNNKNDPRYKYYGGKGIKFKLSFWCMGALYYRDNAEKMKQPTIDRINNKGNYTFENCRFVERSVNSGKDKLKKKVKIICDKCKKPFFVIPSRRKTAKHCSMRCKNHYANNKGNKCCCGHQRKVHNKYVGGTNTKGSIYVCTADNCHQWNQCNLK